MEKWQKTDKICVFVCDVDGVLSAYTYYGNRGEVFKQFNLRDGMGFELLRKAGIEAIILTQEKSRIVTARAKKLGIRAFQGVKDKKKFLQKFAFDKKLWLDKNFAYVGDDVNDLEAMKLCAETFAPVDAEEEILAVATHKLTKRGGDGCVREAINILLRNNNKK